MPDAPQFPDLTGTVVDQNGATVPGLRFVPVVVTDANGNVVTDPDGSIAIDDLKIEEIS